jgi:hypothetical protein
MQDEYLSRCVVDPIKRKIFLYSNEGSEKEVVCETIDQFMNVLNVIRDKLNDDVVAYTSPL